MKIIHLPSPSRTRLPPGWLILAGLGLLLLLTAAACNLQSNSPAASKSQGSDAVLQFLRYIPDTSENRKWTSFGDAAAWHASWDVPRIANLADLDNLPDKPRAYWLGIMPNQTVPPECLDANYFISYSLKDTFGFDIFEMNRYLYAGAPPRVVTIAEFRNDRQQIADALTAKGYSTQEMAAGWVLYSLHEDYQLNMDAESRAEKMGSLNRILLSEHTMIIGKATEVVSQALDAFTRKGASLADDPNYIASIQALQDSSLKDAGEWVGVIWVDGNEFHASPFSAQASESEVKDLMEKYGLNTDLPAFSLAAFATRHSLKEKTTSLILALVFPKGADAQAASQVLQTRLEKADSLRMKRPFLEVMGGTDKVYAVQAGGLPVTLAVFRLADPEPKAVTEGLRPTVGIRSWPVFILARDLMFLYTP